jgi:RND family efflux transporter MFP subunit
VVFEPQMKSAEAQSAAARAAVEQAELNLRRTRLNAPFNCYVRAENVEIGQYVKSGSNVATVAGTDEIEIIVPLPLEELNWIRIPGQNGAGEVSSVDILLELGKQVYSWEGRVRRLLGDVDPKSRMAALVVTVADPFGTLGKRPSSGPQLAPGTFVQVLIKGKRLENVVVVPRLAVHDDDTVWLVDGQDKLLIRHVEIVRREREDVLVTSGLKSGDRVILTNLSGAADGMLLRPQEAGASR